MNTVAFLFAVTVLCFSTTALPLESDYIKFLRTRPTKHRSELHVEEVLEIIKSINRPSTYGVFNSHVNGFLANERFLKNKSTVTPRRLPTTARLCGCLTFAALDRRTTYPTPTWDNVNPDYTNPFSPSVSVTMDPPYAKTPRTTILATTTPRASTRTTTTTTMTAPTPTPSTTSTRMTTTSTTTTTPATTIIIQEGKQKGGRKPQQTPPTSEITTVKPKPIVEEYDDAYVYSDEEYSEEKIH